MPQSAGNNIINVCYISLLFILLAVWLVLFVIFSEFFCFIVTIPTFLIALFYFADPVTMSLLDSIVEGKEFNSWEEVEELKNNLEKKLSFPLMLGDCKKIES